MYSGSVSEFWNHEHHQHRMTYSICICINSYVNIQYIYIDISCTNNIECWSVLGALCPFLPCAQAHQCPGCGMPIAWDTWVSWRGIGVQFLAFFHTQDDQHEIWLHFQTPRKSAFAGKIGLCSSEMPNVLIAAESTDGWLFDCAPHVIYIRCLDQLQHTH